MTLGGGGPGGTPMSRPRRYPLARPWRLSLDGFASSAGLHPELVRRFVALGLVQATRDASGALWFSHAELATIARIQRLRAGLSLNWAAIGLICDLLDRIDLLERALRTRPSPPARRDDRLWTSTA
jgi:chaperone modulatory protein CbpM